MWVRSLRSSIEELPHCILIVVQANVTTSGSWRNTTIGVPLRRDVTSSGYKRQS